MKLDKEQIGLIKEKFKEDFSQPYITAYRFETLGTLKEESYENFELQAGESLEDVCIRIYIAHRLPKDVKLPAEYHGLRIFYKMAGRFRTLYQNK